MSLLRLRGFCEEQEDKNYSLAILGGDRGIHTFYGEDGVFVEKSGEEGCEEVWWVQGDTIWVFVCSWSDRSGAGWEIVQKCNFFPIYSIFLLTSSTKKNPRNTQAIWKISSVYCCCCWCSVQSMCSVSAGCTCFWILWRGRFLICKGVTRGIDTCHDE